MPIWSTWSQSTTTIFDTQYPSGYDFQQADTLHLKKTNSLPSGTVETDSPPGMPYLSCTVTSPNSQLHLPIQVSASVFTESNVLLRHSFCQGSAANRLQFYVPHIKHTVISMHTQY